MAKSYRPERVVRHDSNRDGEAILKPVHDRMPAILSSRFIKNTKVMLGERYSPVRCQTFCSLAKTLTAAVRVADYSPPR